MALPPKKTVVVTGAGGKLGGLILEKLLTRPDQFDAKAVVRSEKSKEKINAPAHKVIPVDICAEGCEAKLEAALEGADTLVIATSAVPQLVYLSLLPMMWKKLTKGGRVLPKFTFKENQYPEQVDWEGQKRQIDAAKKAGVRKVVLVSSMGGTDPGHFLNEIGGGNILQWKRKAEEYLIASGLTYTILHAGELLDVKGGQREIVLGVDDEFQKLAVRQIPRADVAELAVQSVLLPETDNRSVDVMTKKLGEGTPTSDFAALFREFKGNCTYSPVAEPVSAAEGRHTQ